MKCKSNNNNELSSTIVEQIREIFSTNLNKCSKDEENNYLKSSLNETITNLPNKYLNQTPTNIYSTLTNSSAADTAAAIFQAYSQFNSRTTNQQR